MKKIFIKISTNIYPDGIPFGKGYGEESYKPIVDSMIEVMFEPGMIDESTHLISLGVVGKIAGTRTFSFAGICEQSQIGDILIPSSGLAVSVAKMMRDYYEYHKRPYNSSAVDRFVKKVLDDITNNIPLKSLFMDVKVRNPTLYRQMSLEYKSRFGYNLEGRIHEIVAEQESYTFSNFKGIIRHAEMGQKGGIHYRNLISNTVEMRKLAAQEPDPVKDAPPTKGPDTKQNLADKFPLFKPQQYVTMNFDRGDLLKRFPGWSDKLDTNQKYTTDQLVKQGMTFRENVFIITKKLPDGFYTVAGLDEKGQVRAINVWGVFLRDASNVANKAKGIRQLKSGEKGRFMGNLGLEEASAKEKSDELHEAASDVGLDYFDFISYYKDAMENGMMKPFAAYEKEAQNPSFMKKIWDKVDGPKVPGGSVIDSIQTWWESKKTDPTSRERMKIKMEAELADAARRLLTDDFFKYAKKYSINIKVRAGQLKMTPEEYKKTLQAAGRNGMSVTEYQDKAGSFEKSDAELAQYAEDPYTILINLDKIKRMIKKDPGITGNKDFMDAFNRVSKNARGRIEVFLEHFGLPSIKEIEANSEEAKSEYFRIETAFEELDKGAGKEGTAAMLMPKLDQYMQANRGDARAYRILKESGIDPDIFSTDETMADAAIALEKSKLPQLKQKFQSSGLKDQAKKLDEIIARSKKVKPTPGSANVAPAGANNPATPPPVGQPAVAPAPPQPSLN